MATDTGPLIILGGSNCQVNAFRMAKQRGQHTVLFDYLPTPPAAALADVHLQVSTFDAEACTTAAAALAPAGVMTLGTDQPVYTAARMAKVLGLPTLLNEETAFAATNKARMKEILTESGIPTVPWRLVDERALAALPAKGPVVIKPLDSQGQKGVFLAQSPQVAAGWYAQSIAFSRQDKLLCEEYYPSEEITVSAWVQNGVPTVLSVTDRVTFTHARHIGVCAAHRFPSRAAAGHEETLAALTRQICSAFAIPAGPLYIQYLVGAKGVVVNEIACRIGGAFEDVFIPFLTGFDILAAVMDAALGAPAAAVPAFAPPQKSVRVLMPFTKPGRIGTLTPLKEILALPFVADAAYNYTRGDEVPPFENAGARLGHAVLLAENEAEMARHLARFYEVFAVQDTHGRNMLLRRED